MTTIRTAVVSTAPKRGPGGSMYSTGGDVGADAGVQMGEDMSCGLLAKNAGTVGKAGRGGAETVVGSEPRLRVSTHGVCSGHRTQACRDTAQVDRAPLRQNSPFHADQSHTIASNAASASCRRINLADLPVITPRWSSTN